MSLKVNCQHFFTKTYIQSLSLNFKKKEAKKMRPYKVFWNYFFCIRLWSQLDISNSYSIIIKLNPGQSTTKLDITTFFEKNRHLHNITPNLISERTNILHNFTHYNMPVVKYILEVIMLFFNQWKTFSKAQNKTKSFSLKREYNNLMALIMDSLITLILIILTTFISSSNARR